MLAGTREARALDTLFFIAAKLLGALIRVDTWFVLGLALIVWSALAGKRRTLRISSVGLLVIAIILAIVPVGHLALQPIERTFAANPPLERVDGIIVRGGGEDASASAYWGQVQLAEGGDRYTAGVALARRFPDAKLLFAGGSGALRDVVLQRATEAEYVEQLFLDLGVNPDRILTESRSRNTAENARLSFEIAQPSADEVWVLVTSAFHMPRAMRSFETAGWPKILAYPVDYRTSSFADGLGWNLAPNVSLLNTAIRERVGQLAYYLTAR